MAISDELTELQQNTTALGTIRTSMREKLVAKGVDASTHDFANFPSDVESIPSGGGTDGQFFPMNMTEYFIPDMQLSVKATGMQYDSTITYYTDNLCTTEADMSVYSTGDTITDTVYYLN